MTDERVWLYHPEAKGYFHCPVEAVDAWCNDLGWQVADNPPEEINPAVAENLAWRREQEERAAAEAASSKSTKSSKPAKGTGSQE